MSDQHRDDLTEQLAALTPEDPVPLEETEQGRREHAAKPGFTGTLRSYLNWIDEMLCYGNLSLSESRPHPWLKNQFIHELRLVTAGFSTDEKLIGRAEKGLLSMYWESSHRGGLSVFLIPQNALDSERVHEWMKPETNVFETFYFVDEIRIPHRTQAIDPEREKVEISCKQRLDENGCIRRTLSVMPEKLDDETIRLFARKNLGPVDDQQSPRL